MLAIKRYRKYRDESLDQILLRIRSGEIKCGRYAHLIKIDKSLKMKDGLLFDDKGEIRDGYNNRGSS